jgi:lysophospholipase L1-like esterase
VDYQVDAYALLEDPGNPDTLLAAYDDGSHLHLSDAGYAVVADAVIAKVFA